jgi:hypothetical protein
MVSRDFKESQMSVPIKIEAQPDHSGSDQTAQETGEADPRRLQTMVAEGAYLRAERCGFRPDGECRGWLAAEREITEKFAPGELRCAA